MISASAVSTNSSTVFSNSIPKILLLALVHPAGLFDHYRPYKQEQPQPKRRFHRMCFGGFGACGLAATLVYPRTIRKEESIRNPNARDNADKPFVRLYPCPDPCHEG